MTVCCRNDRTAAMESACCWSTIFFQATASTFRHHPLAPGPVDLIEDAAVGKVRLLGRRPAAELVDGHEVERGKPVAKLLHRLGVARAEIEPAGEFLSLRGVQKLQVGLGRFARAP